MFCSTILPSYLPRSGPDRRLRKRKTTSFLLPRWTACWTTRRRPRSQSRIPWPNQMNRSRRGQYPPNSGRSPWKKRKRESQLNKITEKMYCNNINFFFALISVFFRFISYYYYVLFHFKLKFETKHSRQMTRHFEFSRHSTTSVSLFQNFQKKQLSYIDVNNKRTAAFSLRQPNTRSGGVFRPRCLLFPFLERKL